MPATINQISKGALTRLKVYIYIYICGIHLGLLPQIALGDSSLPSLSLLVLVNLFSRGDLGLYLYLLFNYACIFNSRRICAQVLYDVPACSIPRGYVHNFYIPNLFDWCVACACILNSYRICAQFLYCIGFVPAYSIPVGYVHNSVFFLSDLHGVSCLHVQFS